jgi:hippurate hydrolase
MTDLAELAELYRDLHAHPELSYAEHRTAGIVAERLTALGLEVLTGVGVTGVVGVLRNGDGPVVLLRADMDGLPVLEATGLPYASTAVGTDPDGDQVPVMHACGHDMHVTCLLGAVAELAEDRTAWSGTLVALFQPAEELGSGADAMIGDGLYDRVPKPDVVLGQHVIPAPAGMVIYCPGPAMAAADGLRVTLYGKGGHGSRPEAAIDPVVMAASTVLRLQTIVSREITPADTAVVTVGALQAGTKENIIPDQAILKISTRSFDESVRGRIRASIERIVMAEAAAAGAEREPEIVHTMGFPVTYNDPDATQRTGAALTAALGRTAVMEGGRITGSEDVGALARAVGVPLVYWWFGGVDPDVFAKAHANGTMEQDLPSNHSPLFAPVIEPTLTTGIRALVAAAKEWLG